MWALLYAKENHSSSGNLIAWKLSFSLGKLVTHSTTSNSAGVSAEIVEISSCQYKY